MDAVRHEIEIAAPPEQVWEHLTVAEHLRSWYAFDGAAVDLRPDGVLEHRWDEHGRYLGVIDVLDAPRRLGYRYAQDPDAHPEPGRQTHVLFELTEPGPGRTRLQVCESGIDTLAIPTPERTEYATITGQAWQGSLAALAEQVERSDRDSAPGND